MRNPIKAYLDLVDKARGDIPIGEWDSPEVPLFAVIFSAASLGLLALAFGLGDRMTAALTFGAVLVAWATVYSVYILE